MGCFLEAFSLLLFEFRCLILEALSAIFREKLRYPARNCCVGVLKKLALRPKPFCFKNMAIGETDDGRRPTTTGEQQQD